MSFVNHKKEDNFQRIRFLSFLIALVLGFLHSWASRYSITPDGVTYLDMADFIIKGDVKSALLPSWCPLYPFLLSVAFYLIKPATFWEYPLLHLVNYLIYIATLFSFDFFLMEFLKYRKKLAKIYSYEKFQDLPDWAFIAIGYSLFFISSLYLITLWSPSPDMCFATFVYLATAMLLRINNANQGYFTFFIYGLILGLGNLAKTPMFLIAVLYLFLTCFPIKNLVIKNKTAKIFLCLLVFITICTPYIYVISEKKGYFTIGESGKLNYAWYINDVQPFIHWQGESTNQGKLVHPTRQVFTNPDVYEFATPFNVTYPPFYDPSYWYEGVKAYFAPFRQLCSIAASIKTFYRIFSKYFFVLIIAILISLSMSGRKNLIWKDLFLHWRLLLPSVFTFIIFSLVHLEPRYIGAYIVIFWIGILAAVYLPKEKFFDKLIGTMITLILAMLMITVATSTANELSIWKKNYSVHSDWHIVDSLKKMGVNEGDRIATIGYSIPDSATWARLAKVKIVSEILSKDSEVFWKTDNILRMKIMNAFAGSGARIVVANQIPDWTSSKGWHKIGRTDCFVYFLK